LRLEVSAESITVFVDGVESLTKSVTNSEIASKGDPSQPLPNIRLYTASIQSDHTLPTTVTTAVTIVGEAAAATEAATAAATTSAATSATPGTPTTSRAAKGGPAPGTPVPITSINENEPLTSLVQTQEPNPRGRGRSRTPARPSAAGTDKETAPRGRSKTPVPAKAPSAAAKEKKEKKEKKDKKDKKEAAKSKKKKREKEKKEKHQVKLKVKRLFESQREALKGDAGKKKSTEKDKDASKKQQKKQHKKDKKNKNKEANSKAKPKEAKDARKKAEKQRKRSRSSSSMSSASAGGSSEHKVRKKGRRRWGFQAKKASQAATDFNKMKLLALEAVRAGLPIPPEAKLIKPIVVDEFDELREQIKKNAPDYWVSCLAEGAHVSLELALWKMHTDKMLARECFTHCYLAESEGIKEDANKLIDEFGLGLRTKRVHSNNGPGYVFVLVNEEGVSALAQRNSVLDVTDTRLSTEERLRRSGMQFFKVKFESLLMKASEFRGHFWFTTFAKVGARDCMKRVVASKLGQDYAIEKYDQCWIYEAGNMADALKQLIAACGYGLRTHSIHTAVGPGCLAVLIEKGAKSWALSREDEIELAKGLSTKPPKLFLRGKNASLGRQAVDMRAIHGPSKLPVDPEEVAAKLQERALAAGLDGADQEQLFPTDGGEHQKELGILQVEPGAGFEKGSKEYEETRARQKIEAIRKRLFEVAPTLSKFPDVTTGYLQSRVEQLMGLPAGRLNRHRGEIEEMWPNVLAEWRLGEVWDYLKKKLEVILPTIPRSDVTTERVQAKLEEATQRASGKFDGHRERIRSWLKDKLGEDFERVPEEQARPASEGAADLEQVQVAHEQQASAPEGAGEKNEQGAPEQASAQGDQGKKSQAFVSDSTLMFCVDSDSEDEIVVDSDCDSNFEFEQEHSPVLADGGAKDPSMSTQDVEVLSSPSLEPEDFCGSSNVALTDEQQEVLDGILRRDLHGAEGEQVPLGNSNSKSSSSSSSMPNLTLNSASSSSSKRDAENMDQEKLRGDDENMKNLELDVHQESEARQTSLSPKDVPGLEASRRNLDEVDAMPDQANLALDDDCGDLSAGELTSDPYMLACEDEDAGDEAGDGAGEEVDSAHSTIDVGKEMGTLEYSAELPDFHAEGPLSYERRRRRGSHFPTAAKSRARSPASAAATTSLPTTRPREETTGKERRERRKARAALAAALAARRPSANTVVTDKEQVRMQELAPPKQALKFAHEASTSRRPRSIRHSQQEPQQTPKMNLPRPPAWMVESLRLAEQAK